MSNEDKAFLDDLTINILGGEQKVKLSMYSIWQAKKLTGKSLMRRMDIDLSDPELMIPFIWAMIIEEQPKFDGTILGAGAPDKKVQEILRTIARELNTGEKIQGAAKVFYEALDRCFALPEQATPGESEPASEEASEKN
jgi:hypothetical protein